MSSETPSTQTIHHENTTEPKTSLSDRLRDSWNTLTPRGKRTAVVMAATAVTLLGLSIVHGHNEAAVFAQAQEEAAELEAERIAFETGIQHLALETNSDNNTVLLDGIVVKQDESLSDAIDDALESNPTALDGVQTDMDVLTTVIASATDQGTVHAGEMYRLVLKEMPSGEAVVVVCKVPQEPTK